MINCRVLPPTTCNFCATYGNYIMHTSKMLMSHALINPIAGHFVQTLMTFFPVNLFNTSILYIKTTYKCPLSLPLLCHHPIHSHQVLSRQARIKKKNWAAAIIMLLYELQQRCVDQNDEQREKFITYISQYASTIFAYVWVHKHCIINALNELQNCWLIQKASEILWMWQQHTVTGM